MSYIRLEMSSIINMDHILIMYRYESIGRCEHVGTIAPHGQGCMLRMFIRDKIYSYYDDVDTATLIAQRRCIDSEWFYRKHR